MSRTLLTGLFIVVNFLVLLGQENNTNRTFFPKKGKIVFNKESVILNESKLDSSLQAFKLKMSEVLSFIPKEQEKDKSNPYLDSLKILPALFAETLKKLDPRVNEINNTIYYHEFRDTVIVHYATENNELIGYYKVIYPKLGLYDTALDSLITMKIAQKKPYTYNQLGSLKIVKVEPNDTKSIFGYDCFKVTMSISADKILSPEDAELSKALIEMYVTDKISYGYHPVMEYREVLQKYYPLEIIESNNMIKGSATKYSLEELILE